MSQSTTQSPSSPEAETPGVETSRASLRRALALVAGVLFVFQVGRWMIVPGLDLFVLSDVFRDLADPLRTGVLSSANFSRLSVMALGVWPYVAAWVVFEFLHGMFTPAAHARYRRWATGVIAIFWSVGLANAMQGYPHLVADPGVWFVIPASLSIAAGTMVLVWLGEQITKTGFCDGIWLLAAADILSGLPVAVIQIVHGYDTGVFSGFAVLLIAAVTVGLVVLIVLFETARLRFPLVQIDAADGQVAEGDAKGERITGHHTLKLDNVTVVPLMFAASLIALPPTFASLLDYETSAMLLPYYAYVAPGQPLHLILFGVLVVVFTFLVTAIKVSPKAVLRDVEKTGQTVAAVPQGEAQSYVDRVLTFWTLVVAAYLIVLALLPQLLTMIIGVPVVSNGRLFLIVVLVGLDVLRRTLVLQSLKQLPRQTG
ncbi:MAG: hypothetical protein AAGC70_14695 [Pseudomonadota bacterium]